MVIALIHVGTSSDRLLSVDLCGGTNRDGSFDTSTGSLAEGNILQKDTHGPFSTSFRFSGEIIHRQWYHGRRRKGYSGRIRSREVGISTNAKVFSYR